MAKRKTDEDRFFEMLHEAKLRGEHSADLQRQEANELIDAYIERQRIVIGGLARTPPWRRRAIQELKTRGLLPPDYED